MKDLDEDVSQWIRKYHEKNDTAMEKGKMIILRLRLLLGKLKVIPFPQSSFDSEVYIRKYKV